MGRPMRTEKVSLIGSGGHAMVVLDSLAALGVPAQSITVFDQSPERLGQQVSGHTVFAFELAEVLGSSVHICVGNNQARARLAEMISLAGCRLYSVIDPHAMVSPKARIGDGSFVAPGAIVAAWATIGRCCIINHGAIVDHECGLADFVHIGPGATLAGAVSIGQEALIGAGANILPGVSVAPGSTVGAGAVLVEDASELATYVGIPARKV